MEGAHGWSMLWHVILPQLRPTTFMAIVVTIIGALRSFDLISVMTGGGPFESSTVLAYYMYDQAIKYYRIGYSAAMAVVLFAHHAGVHRLPLAPHAARPSNRGADHVSDSRSTNGSRPLAACTN